MLAIDVVENNPGKPAFRWLWPVINGVLTLALFQLTMGLSFFPLLSLHFFSALLRYHWLVYAIVALATIFVIRTGGLDLSVGAVAGLVSIFVANYAPYRPLVVVVFVALGLALLIGLVNGALVTIMKWHGALITLVMATLLIGISGDIAPESSIKFEQVRFLALPAFGIGLLVVAMSLSLALFMVIRRRPSHEEQAPTIVRRLLVTVAPYALSSLFAGFTGLLSLGYFRKAWLTGDGRAEEFILIALLAGAFPLTTDQKPKGIHFLMALWAALTVTLLNHAINLMAVNFYQEQLWLAAFFVIALSFALFAQNAQIYLAFHGCINRQTFWLHGMLVLGSIQFLLTLLDQIGNAQGFLSGVGRLLLLWPAFAIQAKRWHDLGKSAWWSLLHLIPVVGSIVVLIMLGFAETLQAEEIETVDQPMARARTGLPIALGIIAVGALLLVGLLWVMNSGV